VRLEFDDATASDAPAIAELRNAVAERLAADFGEGHWSSVATERGVIADLRHARMRIVRRKGKVIAAFKLAQKKPWAIDVKYFTPCKRPLYLTAMAVAPKLQRSGLGRLCVEEALRVAKEWPADAIRLDAYDAAAGAGGFYEKCGFTEVGRAVYRKSKLIYYEWMVP